MSVSTTSELFASLLVRWRLDRTKGGWSKVHIRLTPNSHHTMCGWVIPQCNYMEENGSEVTAGAPACGRCFSSAASETR